MRDRNQTQIQGYVEVRATALHPRLHTEGFQLSTIGSSTKGPPPRNYNNSHTCIQEGRHKAKRNYNLVIIKHTNNLGDLQRPQT